MSRRRPERLLGLLAALAVGVVIVVLAGTLDRWSAPVAPADGTPRASPPAEAVIGTVIHVSDGDTIVVAIGNTTERVRYIGLDTPEVAHAADDTPAECWGDEARVANTALVDDREVALERDVSDRDQFGRLLRHVWVSGPDGWFLVGERLIETGAAEARTYRPDTGHDDDFDGAERRARAAGLGLWGNC